MRESFPRLQMAVIVALTGGFGLLASFSLLRLGMGSMAVRYPLALALAYLFFLFLIWLWLRTNAENYLNAPDIVHPDSRVGVSSHSADSGNDGVGFLGRGRADAASDRVVAAVEDCESSPLSDVADSAGSAADVDEFALPIVVIAIAVGVAAASIYVVYIAPVLLAEVLFDGALSYALFRHLRGRDPEHWLSSTFRHTALPFAATAVLLIAVGAAMASYAPGAKSIGEVMESARTKQAAK